MTTEYDHEQHDYDLFVKDVLTDCIEHHLEDLFTPICHGVL